MVDPTKLAEGDKVYVVWNTQFGYNVRCYVVRQNKVKFSTILLYVNTYKETEYFLTKKHNLPNVSKQEIANKNTRFWNDCFSSLEEAETHLETSKIAYEKHEAEFARKTKLMNQIERGEQQERRINAEMEHLVGFLGLLNKY